MPGEHTALAPAHFHGLLKSSRTFYQSLLDLRDDEATSVLDRLEKLEPGVTGLLEIFRQIEKLRGLQPPGNPVVYCGIGPESKLVGFKAQLILSQIESLRAVLSDLLKHWGWHESIGPEGVLDIGRLATSSGRLALPKCESIHVERVRNILNVLERPGADLSDLLGEKVSNLLIHAPADVVWLAEVFGPANPLGKQASDRTSSVGT